MRELFPIISHPSEIRRICRELRSQGKKISLVPTMGYLHQGHISLIEIAHQLSDAVIVSIFVNPAQFNNREDFEKYPIDRNRDCQMLADVGIHALFTPGVEEIYPVGFDTWIQVGALADRFEGEFRPGHFRGVATIVAKLFNSVEPDFAIFGEKDFQQLRIIEQMISDLDMPITLVRAPLVREQDGLAMSSRNVRLSSSARQSAVKLSLALQLMVDHYSRGETLTWSLKEKALKALQHDKLIALEYIEIVDEQSLVPLTDADQVDYPRALIAATVGGIRLIDTMSLKSESRAA